MMLYSTTKNKKSMKQRPHPEYLVSALTPLQQVYDSGETKDLVPALSCDARLCALTVAENPGTLLQRAST